MLTNDIKIRLTTKKSFTQTLSNAFLIRIERQMFVIKFELTTVSDLTDNIKTHVKLV